MHRFAFLLAIHFAVCSTQPVWQPLKQALFGDCGGSACSMVAMNCAAAPTLPDSPAKDEHAGKLPDGCCVPFHCCFPCCCFCQQLEPLPSVANGEKNTRPNEETKILYSTSVGGHFQPPEFGLQS